MIVLCLFGGLSLITLIACCNFFILYDEEGFTTSNYLRIRHHHAYSEVVAGVFQSQTVDLRLSDGELIKLDGSCVNRENFYRAVLRHCGGSLPPMDPSVFGMDSRQLAESYRSGMLLKAMILPKKQRRAFVKFKVIYWGSNLLSCLCLLRILLNPIGLGGRCALIATILPIIGMVLYFRFPDYYTAWEIPGENGVVPEELKKYHKRSPMSLSSVLSTLTAMQFWLNLVPGPVPIQMGKPSLTALLWAVFILVALIFLFRACSREYKNYRIGLICFSLWAIFLSLTFWILIWSQIRYPGFLFL